MGWKTYSSGDGVVVDKQVDKSLRLKATFNSETHYLYIQTVTTTTEWWCLTQSEAEEEAVDSAHNSDSREYTNWAPFGTGVNIPVFVGIKEAGTKKTAQAVRQNDAGAYKLIVKTVVTTSEGSEEEE